MRTAVFAAMVALVAATPAAAHAKLVSATPAPNSIVAAPATLQLSFSESLIAGFSGAELEMIDMPGMKMASPMKMPVTAALSADGKTMVVKTSRPLPRGAYKLDWHAVSADSHRVEGSFTFKVK